VCLMRQRRRTRLSWRKRYVRLLGEAAYVPRSPLFNIGHLTDVSQCKLHQYLWCNRETKCQHSGPDLSQGWPRRVTWLRPDRLTPAW
jgi:hypothetical protein